MNHCTPLRLFAGLATGLLLLASGAWAASFDCAKAATAIEKSICATPSLGPLDEALAARYQALRKAKLGDADLQDLTHAQRQWLIERNRCADTPCLEAAYQKRIEQICQYPGLDSPLPGCQQTAPAAPQSAALAPAGPATSMPIQPAQCYGYMSALFSQDIYARKENILLHGEKPDFVAASERAHPQLDFAAEALAGERWYQRLRGKRQITKSMELLDSCMELRRRVAQ